MAHHARTAAQTSPEADFPLNEQLLDEALHAREEWRLNHERLQKIEEHHEQVSPAVYERVRNDYVQRLNASRKDALEKKREIDREIATLQLSHDQLQQELTQHRERLEEIKFRNVLGEFTEQEYQQAALAAQDKIGKFEAVLSALLANMRRYQSIFEGEEGLLASSAVAEDDAHTEEVEVIPQPTRRLAETPIDMNEPATDAAGFLIESEEENYFAEGGVSDMLVADERPPTRSTPAAPAELVTIAGRDTGKTFSIRGNISLGRAETNSVVVHDAKASRQHARIQQHGSDFVLIDLNSSNGTLANGQRITEHVLASGDQVQIGDTVWEFRLAE